MITLACFAATMSAALIYDVLPPIMGDLSALFGGGTRGDFIAQLAGTLPFFGVMVAGLVAGPLIDRIGLRPALLAAMALFALAGSAGIALDRPATFLLARLIMGFGIGFMMTCCTSLVAIFFRGAARARMSGMLTSTGSLAGIVFVVIAGWTTAWWWRAPFLLHAAVVIVFLAPVLLTGPITAAAPQEESALGHLQRLRPMLPVFLTGFAWFVVMLMSGVQAAFVMILAGIGDHATIAWLYALNATAVMITSTVFGYFAGRLEPTGVLRVAFLLLAAALCIIGLAQNLLHFVIGLTLNGIAVGVGLTALWTWGMRRAPHDIVPRAMGAMTTCIYLGGAVSPLITAPFRLWFGVRGQFLGVAAITVLAVVLLWLHDRRRPRSGFAPEHDPG